MNRAATPFRVGLLVIAAAVLLFLFLSFVKKGGMEKNESIRVFALFHDASGLGKKSRVQIAGIAVGEVGEITLSGTQAKVQLIIKKEISLRKDATITKRSESLLGDYMLDLVPGSPNLPLLEEGGEIVHVNDKTGLEQLQAQVGLIIDDIKPITASIREVVASDAGQGSLSAIIGNMERLTNSLDKTVSTSTDRLDRILANVEGVSGDVRKLTNGEQNSIKNIVDNFETISKDVREVTTTVKRIIGENEGDVSGTVNNLKETLARLDRTLANVEGITKDVKEGKGAVGALLTDQRLGQKIADTVDDVSDFAGRLTGMQIELGLRTEYGINQGAAKTYFGVKLNTKPDKYYLIEAVDDPRGSIETTYIEQNPPGTGMPVTQKQVVTKESLKFSAQFAKKYSFLTFRLGIIESTGGAGIDFSLPIKFFYYSRFIDDALVLKIDAFNFSIEQLKLPRLRATARFTPIEHVFVTVGIDDALNAPNRDSLTNRYLSGRDFFFGVGIYFTDDDFRSILPLIPSP